MPEPKTSRPYQERFLDGYDRHQLRQEVQKIKPSGRFSGMRKKYTSWALGASLALGGLGVPMKMFSNAAGSAGKTGEQTTSAPAPTALPANSEIARDLSTAQKIATQVAGGVAGGVTQVASGVTGAAQEVAHAVSDAPTAAVSAPAVVAKAATGAAEAVKEHFFKTEVPFGQIIYQEAVKNALPPELVAAVVHTESKFIPNARSQAGAMGLMQLVPRTGRWLGASNLNDPTQNVSAGAKYLRYLTDRFNGNTQKAIAAYNAGEGNVRRFGGVPPFRETRNYVQRVQGYQSELGQRISGYDMGGEASTAR
jgi:soluble lytic murein transglycosylase-like protein